MVPDAASERAPSLEGSPFELRTGLSRQISEAERRSAIASGDLGFIHSFTTGSVVDGPGIRLVAWATLCMFRCQYCHNPDTWTLSNGMPVTLGHATAELRKYAAGLKAMHGGFTLSGGEPLMQARFAARLFEEAKRLGIHTALETNGFYGSRLSDAELANIDLVILDMKAFTPEQHGRVTSVTDNSQVMEFCHRLSQLGHPMWLRYVLVPGLTDDPEEMRRVADFGQSLGVVGRAEILPFHQMGRFKWEKLKIAYTLAATNPPAPDAVAKAVGIFREAGLQAH